MYANRGAVSALLALAMTVAAPALADSVAVTHGPNGTVIVNGKPCRVVTNRDRKMGDENGEQGASGNSTTMTVGPNGVTGSTTVAPGANGSSVTVFSGSSSNGSQSSSAAGSDCVIYRNDAGK